ncbi:MAG: endonuclease V [Methanothrix sp.]
MLKQLRPKDGCLPIVIAPAHRVSIEPSLDLTRKYLVNSKLPEPCRPAHQYANQIRRESLLCKDYGWVYRNPL